MLGEYFEVTFSLTGVPVRGDYEEPLMPFRSSSGKRALNEICEKISKFMTSAEQCGFCGKFKEHLVVMGLQGKSRHCCGGIGHNLDFSRNLLEDVVKVG